MKKKLIAVLATGLFLVAMTNAANANLLSNGDFDSVTPNSLGKINNLNLDSMTNGQWDVFDTIPSWTAGANTSGIEIQYNSVVNAYSPNYYVELDSHGGDNTNSSMYQTVYLATGNYTLDWMYHARTNNNNDDNGIKASIGGNQIGAISKKDNTQTSVWENVVWQFSIADAGLYDLEFAAYGADNSLGGFIDSVNLTADPVPEPATMLLFGTGLAGLAGSRLRRKKNA